MTLSRLRPSDGSSRTRASAGGQELHPCEVKSSTRTARRQDAGAAVGLGAPLAADEQPAAAAARHTIERAVILVDIRPPIHRGYGRLVCSDSAVPFVTLVAPVAAVPLRQEKNAGQVLHVLV